MTTDTIVIVGAGQAGGWTAQTLRTEGHTGTIVLIGDELHIPYERPPLSKAVLSGDAAAQSTYLIKREAFDQLALDWRPGVCVESIDRTSKQLRLAEGELIAYDKLILCNGGRARPLQVPGAHLPGVMTLRNLDDARTLAQALIAGNRLVVVGGGWIGLEVAATARKKGMIVTVVEAMKRLCERTVPPEISEYLSRLHGTHGTDVILGAGVERLSRNAAGTLAVMLGDGRELDCDTVVVGIGLIPNDELARDAGLACDGGVVVDAQCRTSDPDIFAAGDVASWHCAWAGRRMRLESWQNAQEQGIAAARSALGLAVDHQPLPWFWSDQYDSNLQIYGMPTAAHRVVERRAPGSDSFILFYLEGDVVSAAVGPNSARDLRFARRLIEQRKVVDPARLADTQVPMAKL
jgi:3-phenylpropionate/trans-cinnamate dioxygenase ferredoxin reductase component